MTAALILDVDGTLVDTNYHHAVAWFRAFRKYDITVPVWRIHRSIGMGGDQLVGEVAGQQVEQDVGDAVRAEWKKQADALLGEVCLLAGAHRLLEVAVKAGYRVVLASSGKPDHVEHYLDLLDARELASAWTSSEDVSATKPAPNLLEVALDQVGERRAVTVGDSVWDCRAAARIDLPSVGVRTGGFSAQELTDSGAARVYDDLDQLRGDLDNLPLGNADRGE